MPPVLNIKPPEVDSVLKRQNYTVSVVGCGPRGILFASAFAEAGFKVICTDADPSVVKKVTKGKAPNSEPWAEAKLKGFVRLGQISATGEVKKAVSQSDIVIIASAAKVDAQRKADSSQIENICKQVGTALHQGALVVLGGIAGFGFTDGTVKETLENTSGLKAGQDFGLAYIPIINTQTPITNAPLTVAAADAQSLEAAATILRTTTANVILVGDVKSAEAAALFTVAFQDAQTALANELAMFCENANINFFAVSKLLWLTNPSFRPSIAQENKEEAYLLLDSGENLNAKLRLPSLARQINEDMVKHAVNLTQDALRVCGKSLRRARVAVLGHFDQTSAMEAFVKSIELKGAKASIYDPSPRRELLDSHAATNSLNEAVEGADCMVVLATQEEFNRLNLKKLRALMKSPSVIVDLAGKFEPKQVETEGFIYRGLGRGTG